VVELGGATLSSSWALSSSLKPASSMARRPARPPVKRTSSVASRKRVAMGPGSVLGLDCFMSELSEDVCGFEVPSWGLVGCDAFLVLVGRDAGRDWER